jgi:hypothetical protein
MTSNIKRYLNIYLENIHQHKQNQRNRKQISFYHIYQTKTLFNNFHFEQIHLFYLEIIIN